ncbi:MAG: D-2-hydroxyacid dehydrogenase [Lachnospiraceae bacterium]|nr:D-2-hydroxyacid dehydrogenase [Lachnospiraceae bacterium]
MDRKMLIALPELTKAQRQLVEKKAAEKGFTAIFCDDMEDAAKEAAEAEIILSGNPALVAHTKALRWFCSPAAGVDHFVKPWEDAPAGAVFSNSSGAYGVTISEHIIMVTLEIMRQRESYRQIVSRREWARLLPVKSILGSRIMLLGTGDIGCETVRKLRGFRPATIVGMNTSGRNPEGLFDRTEKIDDLSELLPETDVLIMSLPGTKATRHILDGKMLALLPDGAIIVNVGRGSSIDEAALLPELQAGRLFAALDVFEKEPLPQDSPLYEAPNLLITPHVSGNMTLPYTLQRITDLFLEDFERYAKGETPERAVDMERGY